MGSKLVKLCNTLGAHPYSKFCCSKVECKLRQQGTSLMGEVLGARVHLGSSRQGYIVGSQWSLKHINLSVVNVRPVCLV